jgi:hypothetical protein
MIAICDFENLEYRMTCDLVDRAGLLLGEFGREQVGCVSEVGEIAGRRNLRVI